MEIGKAQVTSVDARTHRVDVSWYNSDRKSFGVIVINPYSGYSMPDIGDSVLIIEDDHVKYCLGKIELNYAAKIKGEIKTADRVTKRGYKTKDGETFIANLKAKLSLLFSNSGSFRVSHANGDGLKYRITNRLTEIAGKTISFLAGESITRIGNVIRELPGVGDTVIPSGSTPAPTSAALEFLVELTVSTLEVAKLQIGHLKDSLGVDIFGSWGSRLRALLEVANPAGIPVAVLKMDEVGNVELSSTMGITMLDGVTVQLGGLAAGQPVPLGFLLQSLFNSHTHPTPSGPSGPPIQQMTSAQLSTKVFTS